MKKLFLTLFKLALPIIFSNIMQVIYQLIDTFWIGRLGENAVAAISISYPILFLVLSIGIGLAIAGTILVAQYNGRGERKMVNHISEQTIFGISIIALIITITGYIFSSEFIKLMGTNKKIFNDAVSYLKLSFIGSFFVYIFMVFQSLLQGIKYVYPPAIIVFITVILNFILDPLFILKLGYGVNGAAISTIITQFIAAFIGIFLLYKGKFQIKITFSNFKPDFQLILKMFKLGIPSSVEYSVRGFIMTIITSIVSSFGISALAAYGVGIRLFTFVVIIGVGIANATSTLIGHSFGNENIEEAIKISYTSILLSSIVFAIIGFIFFMYSYQISSIFITKNYNAIKLAGDFIRILSFGFIFLGIQISLNGIYRGSGNTAIAMMLTLITMVFLRLPFTILFSRVIFHSPTGIWIAFPLSNFIAAIIGISILFFSNWKEKRIIPN